MNVNSSGTKITMKEYKTIQQGCGDTYNDFIEDVNASMSEEEYVSFIASDVA